CSYARKFFTGSSRVDLVEASAPKNSARMSLSMPTTRSPCCAKCFAVSEPISPDEPVTIIVCIRAPFGRGRKSRKPSPNTLLWLLLCPHWRFASVSPSRREGRGGSFPWWEEVRMRALFEDLHRQFFEIRVEQVHNFCSIIHVTLFAF